MSVYVGVRMCKMQSAFDLYIPRNLILSALQKQKELQLLFQDAVAQR